MCYSTELRLLQNAIHPYNCHAGLIFAQHSYLEAARLLAGDVNSQPVKLGLRPEHLSLTEEDNAVYAAVDVSEMMGSAVHIHVSACGQDVVIVVPLSEEEVLAKDQDPVRIFPWRRCWARELDLAIYGAVLVLVLQVCFKMNYLRISGDPGPNMLLALACLLVMAGAETVMLHLWGKGPSRPENPPGGRHPPQPVGVRQARRDGGGLFRHILPFGRQRGPAVRPDGHGAHGLGYVAGLPWEAPFLGAGQPDIPGRQRPL